MVKFDFVKAVVKWIVVTVAIAGAWVATLFVAPVIAYTARKQVTHPLGKPIAAYHREKYINQGSSGYWEYFNSNIKCLKWWNNLEDGLLGEPSGKFSSSVQGKERTTLNMIRWTLRNPFNYGKRTIPLFHCKVNECKVEYIGDYEINDKDPTKSGWYFVKATHKETGRTYYYFRWVKHLGDGMVRNAAIGFKIKPSHGDNEQDADDADKAFTLRLPFKQSIR